MDTVLINTRLLGAMREDDFAGYDPFDLLNSRVLRSTPFYRNAWFRLGWLQIGKRLPVNLRPFLRVPKMRNPKGVALVIEGLLEDYERTGDRQFVLQATDLGAWLVDQRCRLDEWAAHACWGYHFDWQARAFYVPAGKPNVISTCYVARALYRLGEVIGDSGLQEVALNAAHFIFNVLYTEVDGRCFYAYIPGETAFVHNASLWGSAWCAFAGAMLGDEAMVSQAVRVARQSKSEQAPDGSWVYGTEGHHQFVDGFHTGYNLEALCMLRDALGTREFNACIRKGFEYYRRTFFTHDGAAKYYRNSSYPLDMHSFSQAILTLLRVGGGACDVRLCDKVVARAIELMYLPSTGRFIYQRGRWITNRISYARWTQAWAYYSLAYYNRYRPLVGHASY